MPTRLFGRCVVAVVGLTFVATSCSSHPATSAVTVKPTTNTGLCTLVSPSVVATALNINMMFPETLTHGSATECIYRAQNGAGADVLVRYDTHSNKSNFVKSAKIFERRGLALGRITSLGDQAYYFDAGSGKNAVDAVVVLKGSLQLLVTGPGTVDQIGAIARYALNAYDTAHSASP